MASGWRDAVGAVLHRVHEHARRGSDERHALPVPGLGDERCRHRQCHGDPYGQPEARGAFKVAPGGESADLSWKAPRSDGGADISNYTVEYRKVGDADWMVSVVDVAMPTEMTLQLDSGVRYQFRVTASNVAGTSRPSPIRVATPT